MRKGVHFVGHAAMFVVLTAVTQLGGLAWGLAAVTRRWSLFPIAYAGLFLFALMVAPLMGRSALPCFGDTLRSQSVFYCLAMRNYATPQTIAVVQRAADAVDSAHPGTVTLTLDAGFPFGSMPLLPHLSHDDGEKVDLAFYYADANGYAQGRARSPVGYFAFETLGQGACPPNRLTLRWDMRWLQPLWRDMELDAPRNRALLRALVSDPAVGKVFVEPPLARQLRVTHDKLRFQGCRAARHDDHIHLQL